MPAEHSNLHRHPRRCSKCGGFCWSTWQTWKAAPRAAWRRRIAYRRSTAIRAEMKEPTAKRRQIGNLPHEGRRPHGGFPGLVSRRAGRSRKRSQMKMPPDSASTGPTVLHNILPKLVPMAA